MNSLQLLRENRILDADELRALIETDKYDSELRKIADEVRRENYGDKVYIRGLIEFTNYCKNDCFYCGIRRGNKNAVRYRLTRGEILDCCREGYALGFRTFVLQGGEDMHFTDSEICGIVSSIKNEFPDCAVTLSIGERSRESYRAFFNAGASRYLLRHETADAEHYKKLHPSEMSLENRKRCLFNLKEIGYQVGSGFMVGSPYQTPDCIVEDLMFLHELMPDMIGIGPYITHGGHAVLRKPQRLARAYAAAYIGASADVSLRAYSVHDGARHNSQKRARNGAWPPARTLLCPIFPP